MVSWCVGLGGWVHLVGCHPAASRSRRPQTDRRAVGMSRSASELVGIPAGSLLSLRHETTGFCASLIAEPCGPTTNTLLLAPPSRPYHRLHVASQKQPPTVHLKHSKGSKLCAWHVHRDRIVSAVDPRWHLSLSANGAWTLLTVDSDDKPSAAAAWHVVCESFEEEGEGKAEVPSPPAAPCCVARPLPPTPCGPSRTATTGSASAASRFAQEGYFVMEGLISPQKVERALRFLNHHLGSAELSRDLEPEGLGIEFVRASGASSDAAKEGVVKLGSGRRCTCCLAQAEALTSLLDERARRAISRALLGEEATEAAEEEAEEAAEEAAAFETGAKGAKGASGSDEDGQCAGSATRRRSHRGALSRCLSSRFGVQLALRFPLAPFATGVADGDAALPSLVETAGLDWQCVHFHPSEL